MIKTLFITALLLTTSLINARMINLSATVISDNEKQLTSRYMGFIKAVHVNEGDRVKKGKLLYEIDSNDIDSKKEQAKLNVQINTNQFQTLKLNHERYQRLFEKGLISKFDLEQMTLNFNNAKNGLAIAKAALREVNNQYKYLKVKAPNDGIILKKSIRGGEMAIPGMPALVLSDLNSLKIQTEITQSDLKEITIGQTVQIMIDSLNHKSKGTIRSIVPNSNSMTHTFIVKIDFESNDKVYPGMYANVMIETKE